MRVTTKKAARHPARPCWLTEEALNSRPARVSASLTGVGVKEHRLEILLSPTALDPRGEGGSRRTAPYFRCPNIRHVAGVCLKWQVLTSALPCCEAPGVTQGAEPPSSSSRIGLHSCSMGSEAAHKAELVGRRFSPPQPPPTVIGEPYHVARRLPPPLAWPNHERSVVAPDGFTDERVFRSNRRLAVYESCARHLNSLKSMNTDVSELGKLMRFRSALPRLRFIKSARGC